MANPLIERPDFYSPFRTISPGIFVTCPHFKTDDACDLSIDSWLRTGAGAVITVRDPEPMRTLIQQAGRMGDVVEIRKRLILRVGGLTSGARSVQAQQAYAFMVFPLGPAWSEWTAIRQP